MSDIFREVDEALRTERAQRFWKRHGKLAIAAAAILLIGVAGSQVWRQRIRETRMQASAHYAEAEADLARGDSAQAAAGWDLLTQEAKDDGYALLARLQLAALSMEKGETGAALAHYRAIATDSKLAPDYRDLATLLATQIEAPELPSEAIEKALKPLTADLHPLRGQARETLAAAFLKEGKIDSARTLLAAISDDPTAPTGVRARATELLAALGKAG